ncbi:hypothetical protein J6590_084206 [Homalodisca vitripennis]|nr:hypothetical protein J6590_084206 [Homalodisca vitripennis]
MSSQKKVPSSSNLSSPVVEDSKDVQTERYEMFDSCGLYVMNYIEEVQKVERSDTTTLHEVKKIVEEEKNQYEHEYGEDEDEIHIYDLALMFSATKEEEDILVPMLPPSERVKMMRQMEYEKLEKEFLSKLTSNRCCNSSSSPSLELPMSESSSLSDKPLVEREKK